MSVGALAQRSRDELMRVLYGSSTLLFWCSLGQIDLLLQVVLFGVSPGCPRVVSREGLRSPPECTSGGWHSERILRKLALRLCELELLRSHPKDERGSVREIGLCDRMAPTPHFLELSPTVCG